MPPSEARKILGNEKIIGATCNTFQDIKKAISEGANYVGVGPYRFTTTKKKLSPVLGLEGYKNIMNQMAAEKLSIPILAIGGIEEDDIAPLMQTGIHGIALSGLIKNAANIEAKTKTIIEKLENV
ncbi:thiamine phosphate synthase, partial [Odoribacter sp. OttesenSCG-928-A06]|nr:thiamine phosphate synthase [Odoribacter sp. OttesenSCG-928-A06]